MAYDALSWTSMIIFGEGVMRFVLRVAFVFLEEVLEEDIDIYYASYIYVLAGASLFNLIKA